MSYCRLANALATPCFKPKYDEEVDSWLINDNGGAFVGQNASKMRHLEQILHLQG